MFEKEKQTIVKNISESLFRNKETVKLKDILNLPISEASKKFFSEDVDRLFQREIEEIKRASNFDFSLPEVQAHLNSAYVILKLNKDITKKEFVNLFYKSLDFNLEYLLNPFKTLTNYIFDFHEKVSSREIISKLRYVTLYGYLPELMKVYIEKKKPEEFGKMEFYTLLLKFDKEYCRNYGLLEHYELFSAFRNFLKSFRFDIDARPEAEAFESFLRDRGYIQLADVISKTKEALVQTKVEFREYLNTLNELTKELIKIPQQETKEEISSDKEKEPLESVKESDIAAENIKEESAEKEIKQKDANKEVSELPKPKDMPPLPAEELKPPPALEEILNERLFPDEPEEPIKIIEKPGKKEPPPVTAEKQNNKQEPFIPPFDKPEPVAENSSIIRPPFHRHLDYAISPRLRKKVIKKLFGGNEIYYINLTEKLSVVKDWDEASHYLAEAFQEFDIDPYSGVALDWTEFLFENVK